jgi:hypothetical protein
MVEQFRDAVLDRAVSLSAALDEAEFVAASQAGQEDRERTRHVECIICRSSYAMTTSIC